MGGKDSPDAPDYAALAQQQAQGSRDVTEQQTWANRPTQNTPWGQVSWDQTPTWDPATEQWLNDWTQNVNLTPGQQQALDSQQEIQQGRSDLAGGLLDRVSDEYGTPMDWTQFSEMGGVPQAGAYGQGGLGDYGEFSTEGFQNINSANRYNQGAREAVMGQFEERMGPRFQEQQESLEIKMRNQGIKPGDEAYDKAMERMTEDQSDQRRMNEREATLMGGQEAERFYGMDMGKRGQQFNEMFSGAGFSDKQRAQQAAEKQAFGGQRFGEQMQQSNLETKQRQQQMAEEMQKRGFSLNEINSILSGQQIGMPGFQDFNTAARSEGVQSLQAGQMQNTADMNKFGADQAGMNALMGGAGSLMAFSDRRLKTDIVPIGGGWYSYKLFNMIPSVGVMSDEVNPDAVVQHSSGFDMVNYGRV